MPAHFDTGAEDAKLRAVHEQEEEDLARILADKYGLTYTDLSVVPVNMDALRVIPETKAKEAELVAFDKSGKHVSVALRNPQNPAAAALLEELEKEGHILTRFLISEKSLDKALARYADLSYASENRAGTVDIANDAIAEYAGSLTTLAALREELGKSLASGSHTSTSRILEQMLASALTLRASDVHMEPEEDGIRLRFRIDGLLTDAFDLDTRSYKLLSSRIKLLSGLKLNVKDRPQDGRFSIVMNNPIEVRTSVIPGAYGESIVMRLLNPNALSISFEGLGIHEKILTRLSAEIKRPNGMLLTTGPTGSGKTTTLYAFLKYVHTPDIKIITIEDPVEYHIPGIVQTQVDHKDYTFAAGLRSILRQDPDVIMVGEIRDAEVAETAIQAALTGHFVFSTLHTNNAAGTFPRLVDLGADPKVFSSAITVAMAQRLVRTLDHEHRKQVPLTDEEKEVIERLFADIEDPALRPPQMDTTWVPDPKDGESTGYKGRMGLYEAIFMDDELGAFLRDNPSEGDIAKHVRRQGMLTMAQQGVLNALNGLTSLEEVFRVVDLPRD
ncbi:MAG TPA: GspE/PulE family protein [Candidatus Paceibacterota bacterium]|nr:GspE/PulE family protein [Candidatus Paceibacterota bacterium]